MYCSPAAKQGQAGRRQCARRQACAPSDGKHLRLEDARVFDLPDRPPPITVASSGAESAVIAAQLGDGLFATEPKRHLVQQYLRAGGEGPCYAEVPLAWAQDEDRAVRAAPRPAAGW